MTAMEKPTTLLTRDVHQQATPTKPTWIAVVAQLSLSLHNRPLLRHPLHHRLRHHRHARRTVTRIHHPHLHLLRHQVVVTLARVQLAVERLLAEPDQVVLVVVEVEAGVAQFKHLFPNYFLAQPNRFRKA